MNRAIAYILVDGEVGPHSLVANILDEKKRDLAAEAANLGLELSAVYADVRREMEAGRLGLRTMLNDVRKHELSAVVVESFDSFADPHTKMLDTFKCLMEQRVRIYVLEENRVLHAEHVELIMRALEMALQFDKKLNAVRIKRGLQHASLSGRPIGRRPFEFSDSNVEIFENVQLMRKRGLSLRDICKALNAAGVVTSSQRTWHPTTIKRMIERAPN